MSETDTLYEQIERLSVPSPSDIADRAIAQYYAGHQHVLPTSLLASLRKAFEYEANNDPPAIEYDFGPDTLRSYISRYSDDVYVSRQVEAITNLLSIFTAALPRHLRDIDGEPTETPLTIPFLDAVDDPTQFLTNLLYAYSEKHIDYLLFGSRVRQNWQETLKHMPPRVFKGSTRDMFAIYLQGTPWMMDSLLEAPVPFPLKGRNEHHWIVAPQGSGKTQTLQLLISEDLKKVMRNEASIVVMDSQGDLIRNISHLALFKEHPEKLVVIDPTDLLPINLFSMGRERRRGEAMVNNTIDLLTYCFNSLIGAGLTPKQATLFNAILRVCVEIPDATLDTFYQFLTDDISQYQDAITRAGRETERFFSTQYKDASFKPTKQEVAWRLSYLRQISVFDRMFAPNASDFDLYTELGSSKCILINTDRYLLGDRTEIFGRLWIAMLLQAAQQRAEVSRLERLPTYCYVDEAQDYIAQDTNINRILDQARKMNVGMILAHQRSAQVSPQVLDALANCSIRMARATSDGVVSRALQTSPDFVNNQPDRTFATYVRGMTRNAVSVQVPFFVMENMPRMSEQEYQAILSVNRDRYTVPEHTIDVLEQSTPPRPVDPTW